MNVHNMMWMFTILSIIGVVLNIYKLRSCFIFWSITNVGWLIYDFWIGAIAQGVLFSVYLILSIWGLVKWGRKVNETTR